MKKDNILQKLNLAFSRDQKKKFMCKIKCMMKDQIFSMD
jgi:hypothetical protein